MSEILLDGPVYDKNGNLVRGSVKLISHPYRSSDFFISEDEKDRLGMKNRKFFRQRLKLFTHKKCQD